MRNREMAIAYQMGEKWVLDGRRVHGLNPVVAQHCYAWRTPPIENTYAQCIARGENDMLLLLVQAGY